MNIVDAHHHLWDPAAGYAWMRSTSAKFMGPTGAVCSRYEVDDFRAEAATAEPLRLIGSVHLQCGRDAADPARETAWVQQQSERSGLPIGIVAFANLADPGLDALLRAHAASPGFRGVRQMLNWGDDERFRLCERGDYFGDAAWRHGLARLGAMGLSFDLQVNPWQLEQAAQAIERCPGTVVVLNHAGLPFDYRGPGFAQWRQGIVRLAALPHVHVKFSGLGMVDPQWAVDSVRPVFDALAESFGPRRMMFASNFPIDRLYRTYAAQYAAYRALSADLRPAQREDLFARNAARVYRLDIPGATSP